MNHSSSPACSSHPANPTVVPAFAEADYDLLVSFDGAMEPRGTPRAQGAWGFVVVDATGREMHRQSALMPRGACASNNVAEYTALLEALAWVKAHAEGKKVLFQGDSQLVVTAGAPGDGTKKRPSGNRTRMRPICSPCWMPPWRP